MSVSRVEASSKASSSSSSSSKKPKSTSTSTKTKRGNAQRNGKNAIATADESESPTTQSVVVGDILSKIARLETDLAKEAAYRNHAQLERDKTCAFWEISKRALRRSESLGREHHRRLDEVETDAAMRERAITQRLKHERDACEAKLQEMREETSDAI